MAVSGRLVEGAIAVDRPVVLLDIHALLVYRARPGQGEYLARIGWSDGEGYHVLPRVGAMGERPLDLPPGVTDWSRVRAVAATAR